MKILIADDDADSRTALRKTLEAAGHEITDVSSGQEALRVIHEAPPELIISDVLVPPMNGFRLCHAVKRDKKLGDIPFVFYSSTYTDRENEKLALSLGASRYIIKPVEAGDFLEIINNVIREVKEGNVPAAGDEGDQFIEMYNENHSG
ncbi:MAG: response regulator, partial [Nitrospirota bacterium]